MAIAGTDAQEKRNERHRHGRDCDGVAIFRQQELDCVRCQRDAQRQ
jgi:hypothetical protein